MFWGANAPQIKKKYKNADELQFLLKLVYHVIKKLNILVTRHEHC